MKNPKVDTFEVLDKAKQTAEVVEFNHDYSQIVKTETDRLSGDFRELLDTAVHSHNQEIRAAAGWITLEAAAKLTDIPDEKTQLLEFARHYWGSTVTIAKLCGEPNVSALKAGIGMSTIEPASAIILDNRLPGDTARKKMFNRLTGVAEASLGYGAYLIEQPKDFAVREQTTSLTGLQAELAVLMLHQRFTREAQVASQLALPAHYSEDHGLSRYTNKDKKKNSGWDISIHQTDEGELSVPVKIQVKSSGGVFRKKPQEYADDIVVVKLAEDIGHTSCGSLLRPFRILEDVVAEHNLVDSTRNCAGDATLHLANARLDTYSDRLLDMIDEEI